MYTANVDIMSGITKKIIDAKLKEVGIQGEEMGKGKCAVSESSS